MMTLDERIARVQKWLGDRGVVDVKLHRGDAWDTTPYAERAEALLSAFEAVMDGKTSPFTGIGDSPSQPQPVAQGEAVAWVLYHGDDVAGLTNDRSEMEEWERDGLTFAALYKATPTIPTGHRVVPIPFAIERTHKNQAFVTLGFDSVDDCTAFIKALSSTQYRLTVSPSDTVMPVRATDEMLDAAIEAHDAECIRGSYDDNWKAGELIRSSMRAAIDAALAASPSAGGV